MSILSILEYPDPRLRRKARAVVSFDATLKRLIADMFETLYATRGIGLAASQVDVRLKVITIDVSGEANAPQLFINPKILSRGTIGLVEESCLSVPGVVVNVRRAIELRVRAQDAAGSFHERNLEGLSAVCLQHEMDHLDGRLLMQHLSLLQRLKIRSRLNLGRQSHATEERSEEGSRDAQLASDRSRSGTPVVGR